MNKPKIWKWPVGHPLWPAGGWAYLTPSVPGAWWPARSHEDALTRVADYYDAIKGLK